MIPFWSGLPLILVVFVSGCSHMGAQEKDESLQQKTILFIVDGLTLSGLQENLASMPELSKYFLKSSRAGSYVGEVTVPSMTFPNISTILTHRPVSKHGVIGNKVYENKRAISFESVGSQKALARYMNSMSVFTHLKKQEKTSLSLSHYFGKDASEDLGLRLDFGLYFLRGKYQKIDLEVLAKLQDVLAKPYSEWPDFIFVHLISNDSLSHRYGAKSKKVRDNLARLDRQLGATFSRLLEVEESRSRPRVIFTSDHGHHLVNGYIDINRKLRPFTSDYALFIDGRFSYLYFQKDWNIPMRKAWFKQLQNQPFYSAFGVKLDKDNFLQRGLTGSQLASVKDYFGAKNSPDAIFFAPPNVSYREKGRSHHGGLSPDEMYVPVLMRNLKAKKGQNIPTRDLLKFLFKN